MKRFRFPLARVLRVRELQESVAEAELAHAQAQAARAHQYVEAALDELHEQIVQSRTHEGTTSSFLSMRAMLELSHQEVVRRTQLAAIADDEMMAARDRWVEAHRRTETLRRLEDRSRAQWLAEVDAAEVAAADDIGTITWARRQRSQ